MAASKSPPLSLRRGLGFSDFDGDGLVGGLISGLGDETGKVLGTDGTVLDSSLSFGETDFSSGLAILGDFNDLGGISFGFGNSRLDELLGLISTGDVATVCSGLIPFSEFSRMFLIFSPSDSILSLRDRLSRNLSVDCLRGFSADLRLLSLGKDTGVATGATADARSFSGDLNTDLAEDPGLGSASPDSSFDSP